MKDLTKILIAFTIGSSILIIGFLFESLIENDRKYYEIKVESEKNQTKTKPISQTENPHDLQEFIILQSESDQPKMIKDKATGCEYIFYGGAITPRRDKQEDFIKGCGEQ